MRIVRLILWGLLGGAAPLAAQSTWGLAFETGLATFGGHATTSSTTPEASAHPSSTRTWGLRVDRTGRRTGVSVGVSIASTGVELEDDDVSAEAKNVLELIEISPQVSYLIFQPREASVRVHAGAVIDHWSPEGDNARTSVGALGALTLQVPLSTRVTIDVRAEITVTGSVFEEDDLPPEFSRESGWSQRYVLGVRYGL